MSVILLPDALNDLLSLQDYMLDQWGLTDWLAAEDEIFAKLATMDAGVLRGVPVSELASVGIHDYLATLTSHHKLVYRRIDKDIYVYAIAGHRQDFQTLLVKRLLRV